MLFSVCYASVKTVGTIPGQTIKRWFVLERMMLCCQRKTDDDVMDLFYISLYIIYTPITPTGR